MKKIISLIAALTVMSSMALSLAAPVHATEYTGLTNYGSYVMEDPHDTEAEHTTVTQDGLVFNVYGDYAYLSSCEDKDITEAVIPAEVKGVPVIGITGSPFGYCRKLTSIELPETLQYLNWLDIMAPVVNVSSSEKDVMPTLEKISVSKDSPYYTVKDGMLYSKDMKLLIGCPPAMGVKELKISDKTEEIFNYAFAACTDLETAVIPDSIKHIHNAAFAACDHLKSVEIPEGITVLSGDMFMQCSALTDVKIKGKLQNIGFGAFYECTSLKKFDIPDTVTHVGSNAFKDTGCIEEADGVQYVDNWAVGFSKSSGPDEIILRDGTAGIAEFAFILSNRTKHIYVPATVKNAGALAYVSSRGPAVTIDYAGKAMGERSFTGAKKLTDIYIYDPKCDIFDDEKTIPDTYKEPTELEDEPLISIDEEPTSGTRTAVAVISDIPDRTSTSSGNSAAKSIQQKVEEYMQSDDTLPEAAPYEASPVIAADETDTTLEAEENKVTIHGYRGSTAEAYAKKYNRKFAALDDEIHSRRLSDPDENITEIKSDGYTYKTDGHFAWLYDIEDENADVLDIPDYVNGMPVVGADLSIQLFNNCDLTTVKLNSFIRDLNDLPNSRMQNITASPDNPFLTSEGDALYSADKTVLYHLNATYDDEEFVIPDTVKTVGDFALLSCTSLKNVVIPDSVEYIGQFAFDRKVYTDTSDGVCYVGSWAVETAFPVPSSIKVKEGTIGIANGAFSLNSDVTSISYPASLKYTSGHPVSSMGSIVNARVYVNGKSLLNDLVTSRYFKEICFMDADCVIPDEEYIISDNYHNDDGEKVDVLEPVIMGFKGSTAEAYAEKYNRKFVEIATGSLPLYGDANCSGIVDLSDAVLIMQTLSNPSKYKLTDEGRKNADCSGSGDGVTNMDALAVQKYMLKLIPSLPEE